MKSEFSPQDIFRIAVEVEKKGVSLYGALEKGSTSKKAKDLWAYLKVQEEAHAKAFKQMLDNVGDYVVYQMGQVSYDDYLKAIASEYIFTQNLLEEKSQEESISDLEAIDFGIHIEKESILVYSALKDYIQPGKQSQIDRIIDEEKKHLVELTLIKKSLQKGD